MYLRSVLWKLAACVYFNVIFHGMGVESGVNEKIVDCRFYSEARNKTFSIPTDNSCEVYVYVINCLKTSSIISVSTETNISNASSEAKSIVVTFKENTTLDNGEKSLVPISQWTITPQSTADERLYFSRTSQLWMEVTVTGDWSKFPLKFITDEVDFNGYEKSSEDASGEVTPWESIRGRDYRPNSVFLFRINGRKINNIDINLKNLDLDEAVGEYLLIGSGTGPFEGPPPLFISDKAQEKKYKIFNENAYIVFVTSATRSNHTGFQITWNGTKGPDADEKGHLSQDDVLQSVQVCIYNKSAALAEFNKTDPFLKFRKEISEIASVYGKENKLISEYENITTSQVEIFRVSDVIREDEEDENLKAGGFYVMVKIRGPEEGSAAFMWNHLQQIIHNYYNASHAEEVDKYKIDRCPTSRAPNKWTNIGFYAILPILCCLFLVIWAFRHNHIADIFSKKEKGAAIPLKTSGNGAAIQMKKSGNAAKAHTENVYETTVPKVRVTNDQGRRYTLAFNEAGAKSTDEDSDVEVFNRNHFQGPSPEHDPRSVRNQTRLFQQGETNKAFIEDEESCNIVQSTVIKVPDTQTNEAEHYYDTVKSTKGLRKENVEDETKL